ncbi:MAG: hypothetical protein JEY99_17430 [Spirochaetales bacterium]|nr:hypothetical protein [Spirochaetales bacterium]
MSMTQLENALAILNYENYESLPIVHFGFWPETLLKWAEEGHISFEDARNWSDCSDADIRIGKKLGFDFNWGQTFGPHYRLDPPFEEKILEEDENGNMKVLNEDGVIVMKKRNVVSIPTEVDHFFKGRKEWEEEFRVKLDYSETRYLNALVPAGNRTLSLEDGGWDYLRNTEERERPLGLFAGSLIGFLRDFIGIVNLSYLMVDDPDLLIEIVQHVADLSYRTVKSILELGAKFEYMHFWEDICFKNGPLVNPSFFRDIIGPQYKRITDLAVKHGISIISVDCDGMIDHLLPHWLENGVNTMFPIEVGTWKASIAPWREKYGREIRGVGGMDKTVFSRDIKAVESEVERLKALVDLGGYIPCPDHRIAPDASWDNVQYYCDLMRKNFC